MILHQKTIKFDGVLLVSAPDPPNPLFESTLKFKTTLSFPLPLYPVLVFVFFFLVFGGIRVPSKPLFVERDDHLRTLHIGFLRRHQVGFVGIFPTQNKQTNSSDCHLTQADILTPPTTPAVIQTLMFPFQQMPSSCGAYKPFHEEHEFSCGICGTNNPFWSQPSSKAP